MEECHLQVTDGSRGTAQNQLLLERFAIPLVDNHGFGDGPAPGDSPGLHKLATGKALRSGVTQREIGNPQLVQFWYSLLRLLSIKAATCV